jgi:hypothetical protein
VCLYTRILIKTKLTVHVTSMGGGEGKGGFVGENLSGFQNTWNAKA